ncbi:MAG: M20 family metallopeptidase [Planctomycetota bacterium]|jgi:amidohydrolase
MTDEMKKTRERVRASIRRHAKPLKDLARKIHRNPELGFKEEKACAWQVQMLRKFGFEVRSPFAGLDTAYRAARGSGRPAFCFLAEYDALPEIGHACGHNLICAAAIGAGTALAEVLRAEKQSGSVLVMGTPAEESLGGKVIMVKKGAFRNIEAVLEAHPSGRTTPDTGCTAIRRLDVVFEGRAAHAAGAPEQGRNALDAVMLLFAGVNAWRQHMVETNRVHGIVDDGGVVPNVVPARASCVFFLRSLDDHELGQMIGRFRDIARGAALMTDTKVKVNARGTGYKARRPNAVLNEAFVEAATRAGLRPEVPERTGRGSSDFGDVSQVVPGVHVYFDIAGKGKTLPGHSEAFRQAAGTEYAQRQMLRAAEALAMVGWRYMSDAKFRRRVAAGFLRRG